VCSHKLLPGGSRQIADFRISGEFLGLRSVLLHTSDHGIEAITHIDSFGVSAGDLIDAFSTMPRLATAVLCAASCDEAMAVEHLVGVARRSVVERTAHFLPELWACLKLVGPGTWQGYACPLSQYLLSDALGLNAVHLHRVLRQLREKGLMTFRKGEIALDDLERLVALAAFDMTYFNQGGPLLR
jgi:CRP-like cAMP-binding protein